MKGTGVKWLNRFRALSGREKLLFFEALWYQLGTGILLKVVPFRWIPRLLANRRTLTSNPSGLNSKDSEFTLEQIKLSTQRAGLISPWRNRCLVESLAARRMLNRRKILSQLSLGVAKGEKGRMIAHAWLKAGDFEIVEKSGDYSELYRF